MKELISILLIEDNSGDARIVEEYLKDEFSISFYFIWAKSLSEGISIFSENKIDLILADLGLPDSQGMATYHKLSKAIPKIPIIIFTGLNDNELGLDAVKAGAEDYLVKGQVEQQLLYRSIIYAIERNKNKNRQEIIFRILGILNRPNEWQELVKDILHEIKEFIGIEAVGIRLQKESDYPYIDTFGFPNEFFKTESSLCIKDLKGNTVFDKQGKPMLACMCGNVIQGRINPDLQFFTSYGSFWTNSTTKLLASTSETDHKGFTRNKCNKDGYESVALIPLFSGKEIIGLLQLNDKRTSMFTLDLITFFEEIASTIGIAYNRMQSKHQIRESEQKFRTIFESAANLITSVNSEGFIVECNNQSFELLGYKKEELIGQPMGLIIYPEDMTRSQESLGEILEVGFSFNKEYRMVRKDGQIIHIIINSSALKDVHGKLSQTLCIINDITERKQVENDLMVAKERAEESDRLKSAFLANMSHEIRTPMNGILGFAELLKKPNLTYEQQQQFISIIGDSGERMLRTINSIMDISKIEAGLMRVYISKSDINKKIESLYNFFALRAESKGVQLSFNNGLSSNEAIIKTDDEKFTSILTNLVNNAFNFTTEGSIEFGYEKKGKFLEFYIKDTGIGIPKDRQDAIFERFIKADIENKQAFQGSGLGLAISKSYAEMLGGRIWVESKEGLGSTFYFTIPYNAVLEENIEVLN